MTSHIFLSIFELPTLSYSITSNFWGYLTKFMSSAAHHLERVKYWTFVFIFFQCACQPKTAINIRRFVQIKELPRTFRSLKFDPKSANTFWIWNSAFLDLWRDWWNDCTDCHRDVDWRRLSNLFRETNQVKWCQQRKYPFFASDSDL